MKQQNKISFYNTLMDSLHTPAVRDLAWVIGSPNLLDENHAAYAGRVVEGAWCDAQSIKCAPKLMALDRNPSSLHDFIAARPTRRLGHYFETLIAYWLAHILELEIIATNLQVRNTDRTVGEYDFLLRDENSAVCHWEAAVKFYLQAEPIAEQHAFIGPGGRDRLDIKLNRVFTHQLNLGTTPEGRATLPSGLTLNKAQAFIAQAFIKGMLFFPLSQTDKFSDARTSVAGISDKHLSGWWVRHPIEKLLYTTTDKHWIILPRLRWLAPARLTNNVGIMRHDELSAALDQHFSASRDAVHVAELRQNTEGEWREVSRGFVVCNTWPVI